ncbi:hypothetical protein AK51_13570 [Serratia nematodiphila DZ0503SBS1]|nr:hypothetical protein AK51_13570 [Serratia nematodiphila DZ0503SBS1]
MKDNNLFERINEKLTFSLRKRVPSILQSESSECGLACLAMIASYYGFNVDMLSLRQRFEHRSMYSYVRLSIDRCTATYV